MSMYLYSILAAVAFAWSLRHIKAGPASALEVLAFSWFYIIDTIVNLAYTALFATTWFLVLSQQADAGVGQAMNDTAGFTDPTHVVSSVTITPTQIAGDQKSAFDGTPASQPAALGQGVLHPEQYPSIFALVAILLIKVYFILIVMSFARTVVKATEGSSISPYGGWRQTAYKWMTKGSYWSPGEDLRLSKARSSRRSDETRR